MDNDPNLINQISITINQTDITVPPEGQITINAVIGNLSTQERFLEITIHGVPESWWNTTTPVVKLAPDESQEVEINISPPPAPQSRVGRYPLTIRVTDQENTQVTSESEASLTVAAIVKTEGRIGVLMQSNQFAVSPGNSLVVPIVLINRGIVEDTFRFSVEGFPASWISTTAAAVTLEAGQEKEITLTIQPPRSPLSHAGRNSFNIKIMSQTDPNQSTMVSGILTIAAYSQYTAELAPESIESGQPGIITIKNQGNIHETYTVTFTSPDDELLFEPGEPQQEKIPAGESKTIEFTTKPRRPPLIGGEVAYAYVANIESTEKSEQALNGEVVARGLIPTWVLPVLLIACIASICAILFFFNRNQTRIASITQTYQAQIGEIAGATQTAAFNQTAAAEAGERDDDGDGLTNREEAEIGTDPLNPDTDGDELLDGEEVKTYKTNPLNPDTDADALSDGEEVLRRRTDPLNPDTDGDGLTDGDEVVRGTDPLKFDTDEDKLSDGQEIQLGTNPLNPDTDNDGLIDGDESPPCPDPLNPDSDGDSIIDGQDLDPCDPNNPSLTATAEASQPTETQALPTSLPTATTTTIAPTEPVQPPINNLGIVAFESNREGNSEIYALNTNGFVLTRLTIDPALDTQPSWSPNGTQIVFVSNRSGNNDIYIMNADGTALSNITNDPADDQYPSWSPDGQWIAFSSNRDGNQEVYKIQTDGSEITNLSNNPSSEDYQPSWFEDSRLVIGSGEWIAFTTNRDGNQEIYIMRNDGSDVRNVTNHPANDYLPEGSPDGTRITFTSNRDGNQEVYISNLDGSSPVNLSQNSAEDYYSTWSPDNQWVAFTSNRSGNQEIFIVRDDATNIYNLTNNPAEDRTPAWY